MDFFKVDIRILFLFFFIVFMVFIDFIFILCLIFIFFCVKEIFWSLRLKKDIIFLVGLL